MASMRALRGLSFKRAATLLACKHVGPTRILRSITVRAAVSHDKEYQQTVTALMHLGLTASVLEQVRQERHAGLPPTEQNVKSQYLSTEWNRMYQYLERMGLKAEDLNGMNAIHITGTKGKGSACAMIESILRAHGFKTGFYSSPHILEVRERIRINGLPLSKTQFVSHFWDCHNKFSSTKEQYEGTMPGFFQFLTLMAFRIFLQEKIDVAVIEAGIGGAYDPTNIMPKPLVSAITSIGCDHSDILGNTLTEIPWQKGGIYKPGYPAFTSPRLPEPLKMLSKRAKEQKPCSAHLHREGGIDLMMFSKQTQLWRDKRKILGMVNL